ncbi:hypothetical protein [Laceyella putida]|uniref:Uncharacterized protein n=1 Tax=Laceyella putida TaxID=110101 RepID=A0ABW2RNH9_9BACL
MKLGPWIKGVNQLMYYDDYDPYLSYDYDTDYESAYEMDEGNVEQLPPRVAPGTLRMYVGQIVTVVIRGVSRRPISVYVASVNRFGDATLISCRAGVPRRIVVSARDVTIVG